MDLVRTCQSPRTSISMPFRGLSLRLDWTSICRHGWCLFHRSRDDYMLHGSNNEHHDLYDPISEVPEL